MSLVVSSMEKRAEKRNLHWGRRSCLERGYETV